MQFYANLFNFCPRPFDAIKEFHLAKDVKTIEGVQRISTEHKIELDNVSNKSNISAFPAYFSFDLLVWVLSYFSSRLTLVNLLNH